jgi:hypothetical protein
MNRQYCPAGTWTLAPLLFLAVPLLAEGEPVSSDLGTVILNEAFVDGSRLHQSLPTTSAWYGSLATSLTQPGEGRITSITGQTILTYFTDWGTVSLDVGEKLRVTFDFQMENPSAEATHSGIRVGVINSTTGLGRVWGDAFGSGNANFSGYSGYGGWIHPQGADTRLRERTDMEHSGLLNSNNVWTNRARNTSTTTQILPFTTYTGEFNISRTAGGVVATFSISGPNFDTVTLSYDDVGSSLFEFDSFGIWTNSNSGDAFNLTRVGISVLPDDVSSATNFAAWQALHFPGETDPDIIGTTANPAGDGIENLLKYAFGLSPHSPATWQEALSSELSEENLRLTYLALADAEDIEYIPEVSVNLLDWNSGSEHLDEVDAQLLPGGEFHQITVQPVQGTDSDRVFLRVLVRQK